MKFGSVAHIMEINNRWSTNLGNTPGIIKYPFWNMTEDNPKAVYACINYGEAFCPRELEDRAICIDGDIGDTLERL